MKLWFGGEIQADVADEYRLARNHVEETINAAIEGLELTLPVDSWDCIGILRDDDEFEEITKYSRKQRDMDFRLKIDYEAFKAADPLQREALMFVMLDRSLSILAERAGTDNDIEKLRSVVRQVARDNGWI